MRIINIRGLLWMSLSWMYAISENISALPFVACFMIASSFENLSAFGKALESLHLWIVSPGPSIFRPFIHRATAYLARLWNIINPASVFGNLFQIPTATCIWGLKCDWAYIPALISQCLLETRHWIRYIQDPPTAPFLALTLCSLPGVTSALPTGGIPKADDGTSTDFLLALLFCSFCALGVLAAGHFIAKRKGEMATYGTFMGIESMAWWLIATDPNNSTLFLFTMLGLWTVSSYVFGHAAFDQMKIPKSAILYTIIIAGFLDVSLVHMTTNIDIPPSQRDLLTPALLSMSVALGMTVVSYPMIRNMLRDQPGDGLTSDDGAVHNN